MLNNLERRTQLCDTPEKLSSSRLQEHDASSSESGLSADLVFTPTPQSLVGNQERSYYCEEVVQSQSADHSEVPKLSHRVGLVSQSQSSQMLDLFRRFLDLLLKILHIGRMGNVLHRREFQKNAAVLINPAGACERLFVSFSSIVTLLKRAHKQAEEVFPATAAWRTITHEEINTPDPELRWHQLYNEMVQTWKKKFMVVFRRTEVKADAPMGKQRKSDLE